MTFATWIICERGGRWTPALRTALARGCATGRRWPIREMRHLAELASELAERPASVLAIEVHLANLGEVLDWLAATRWQFPLARCVALVDRDLGQHPNPCHAHDALREAGALEIAESPRRLRAVLELARRHAAAITHDLATPEADNLSMAERAWAALPWQDA